MRLNDLTLQDGQVLDITFLLAGEDHVDSAGLIIREELAGGWVYFEEGLCFFHCLI